MKHLSATALAFLLAAGTAQARPEPTPPPSGIVIHLFGPDSIASHILPTGPTAAPAAQGSAASAPQAPSAAPGGASQAAAAAPAATAAYPEPTAGDILHQMFVTGDPNVTPAMRLPKGKTGGQ